MYLGRIVELRPDRGRSSATPRHPYTQALLEGDPAHGRGRRAARRRVLAGEPPSPIDGARRLRLPSALPTRHGRLPARPAAAALRRFDQAERHLVPSVSVTPGPSASALLAALRVWPVKLAARHSERSGKTRERQRCDRYTDRRRCALRRCSLRRLRCRRRGRGRRRAAGSAPTQDSTTFDPIKTIQNADIWVMNNMHAFLVRANAGGEPRSFPISPRAGRSRTTG